MSSFSVLRISAQATRPLRQRILRPNQALEELVYDGDDAMLSAHFGVYSSARADESPLLVDWAVGLFPQVLGIASVYNASPFQRFPWLREDAARANEESYWRLRAMAVLPELRGQGLGSMLLRAAEAHAREHGGTMLWFDARLAALPFYQRHGYQALGARYDIAHAGAHHYMQRSLLP
ncbi:MAG: GNAT family N-acetyltransferase [Myxococcota bacterium]|jgi:GNAT superfamily N-acetyltransferase|nr:GNAT family N-acetyltransferase [Myxococcota bacterium]